ncbi:MAG TPA: ATP-binding protein, partial [Gemmatimonadales bacterium]|nr:ATP-binding protein [Gemmatimonadales bacterium]
LVTTLVIWRALDTTEEQRLEAQIRQVSDVSRRRVAAELDGILRLLRRGAAWTSGRASLTAPSDEAWLTAMQRLVDDTRGLRAYVWLDSALAVRGIARADEEPLGGTAQIEALAVRQLGTWPEVRNPRAALSVIGRDDAGAPLLALAVPMCGSHGCSGFALALFQTDSLFAQSLDGIAPGFMVTVGAAGQPVYQSAIAPPGGIQPGEASAFELAGLPWTVEVRPSRESVVAYRSDLPVVVAALGGAVSVLLTMTLLLLQSSHKTARSTERARLARAVESATDGLWERNLETGETSRSTAVWRRLGYDPDTIVTPRGGIAWESLIHTEDRPEVDARMARHLAGTLDTFEAEYRVRSSDGDWHWIVDRGRVIERDERQRPVRIAGICADVTDRKRSDLALAESEQRFRTMFHSGFQLQHLLDINCRLLEANRTSLEFGGFSMDDVRGKYFWETPWWAGQEGGQRRLRKACEDALAGKTVRYQEEFIGAGGRVTLMDFSLTPILDSEHRVVQLLAEGRDISERQRVENTLRELDTLSTMGRLAARVAHEINNPLAGIQNSFLLIKGAIPESHPYYSYVGAIEREIARMAGITRQLYETYRPDGDGREEASIPILISDAVTMLRQVNRATGVRIEVDTSGAPSVLPLPGALLRQAVYNLVQNAVEASPQGGSVQVRAWVEDNTFFLSVSDQGPGVPEDIRTRIFEPFVTTKTGIRTGGMGLGLSLVKRSVMALGGHIDLRDHDGGGAEFRLAIPLR